MLGHGELGRFLWIVGCTIAVAVPIILQRIRLPRRLQYVTLSDGQLTAGQREFFASYDSRLKEMGYTPFVTYRISNIPGSKNLFRTYITSTDPVRCTVQLTAAGNGPVQFEQVQFITQYADGSQSVTTNRQTSRTFDCEPDKFVQDCSGLTDLGELKGRHDRFSEQYMVRGPVFTDTAHFFDEAQRRYDKEATYGVHQKLLRLDAAKDEYRVTLRWALRMQSKMWNPFADNFTLRKLGAALAIGGLPVIVGMWQMQIVRQMDPSMIGPIDLGWFSMLTLSYVIAGIAAGMMFGHKSFLWAFLLGYIPTLLVPSGTSHTLGMSLLMAWTALMTFKVYGRAKRLV